MLQWLFFEQYSHEPYIAVPRFWRIAKIDPNPAELEEARRLNEQMVLRALAMDGTCSGEHGVGIGKMKFLEREGDGPEAKYFNTPAGALFANFSFSTP